MENVKTNVKTNQKAAVTAAPKIVVTKPKKATVVDVIRPILEFGFETTEQVAEKAMAVCKTRGMSKNSKGIAITQEKVQRLVSAMLRDINGGKTSGWWTTYKVVDYKQDNKQMQKIVPKATA